LRQSENEGYLVISTNGEFNLAAFEQ